MWHKVHMLEDELKLVKALQQQWQMERLACLDYKVSEVLHHSITTSPTRSYQPKIPLSNNKTTFKDRSNNTRSKKKYEYCKDAQNEYNKITVSPTRNKYKYFGQKENIQQQKPKTQQIPQAAIEKETKLPQTPQKVQPAQQVEKKEPVLSTRKEQNEYEKLKERLDKLQQQHKKSLQKISTLQQQIAQLQQEKEDLIPRSSKFFEGQVLVGFQDYKERLTQLIQQNFGAKIKRTKLLFRLEKDHPRNLHPFVDGHSPFVVIVKNKKEDRQYHFACVSQGAISKDLIEQKRGWLMSLTNGRTYSVANGKSALLYDGMYLIFGNQELRIDGSSSKVFSNFGISNSFYNTTGNDVRDFLGPGLQGTPREADIDSYEIFQVIF